uniref:Uncharacterized protein n=1 Tax=Cannabis sativa TaxID=3483 RepID=A0A803QRY8_CANSA
FLVSSPSSGPKRGFKVGVGSLGQDLSQIYVKHFSSKCGFGSSVGSQIHTEYLLSPSPSSNPDPNLPQSCSIFVWVILGPLGSSSGFNSGTRWVQSKPRVGFKPGFWS